MSNEYSGTWRIIDMEAWDQDYIDMVMPGYIAFDDTDSGEFHFEAVHGFMDDRIEPYGKAEHLEFSWEGEDEMDPASGRGWAMIRDGHLQGKWSCYDGDDAGCVAVKHE